MITKKSDQGGIERPPLSSHPARQHAGRNQTKVGLKVKISHERGIEASRRNQTKVGLKVSSMISSSLPVSIGRNQTKVGLKVFSQFFGAMNDATRRNQTKVGLKALPHPSIPPLRHTWRRNQTKVGLKGNLKVFLRDFLYQEEIRPRWDWKTHEVVERSWDSLGRNQTKVGLKGLTS